MKNKILKFVKSTYGIIIILFIFWMIFFDSNSLIIHSELNNDIKELNEQKTYYEKEIAKDNIELEMIQSDSGLEKYAREKLFMKKDNEEIFLIEYDTILDQMKVRNATHKQWAAKIINDIGEKEYCNLFSFSNFNSFLSKKFTNNSAEKFI